MEKYNTHGGYFNPGLVHVGAGGTHEQNPNGGVQMGTDSQGIPNLVEEGEDIYDAADYVFSARLKATAEELKKFKLPEKYAGKTFAEISEKLSEEASNRQNDMVSSNGMGAMLDRLLACQDEHKRRDEMRQLEEELANLSPEELAMLQQQLDQSEMASEWQPQVQTASQMPVQNEMPAVQAAQMPGMEMQSAVPEEMMYPEQMPLQQPVVAACGGFLPNYFAGGGYYGDDEDEYLGGSIAPATVSASLGRNQWLDLVRSGKSSLSDVPSKYRPWIEGETSQFRTDVSGAGSRFLSSAGDVAEYLDDASGLHMFTEPTVTVDGQEVTPYAGTGVLEWLGTGTKKIGKGLKDFFTLSEAEAAAVNAARTERAVAKGVKKTEKGAKKIRKAREIISAKQAATTEKTLAKQANTEAGDKVAKLQAEVDKLLKDKNYVEARKKQDELNKAISQYTKSEDALVAAEKNANRRRPKTTTSSAPETSGSSTSTGTSTGEGTGTGAGTSSGTTAKTSWWGGLPTWAKFAIPIGGTTAVGVGAGAIAGARAGRGTYDEGYADDALGTYTPSSGTTGAYVEGYYDAEGGPLVRKYDWPYNSSSVLGTGDVNVAGDKWHPKSGLLAKGADYFQQAARNAGLLKDYRWQFDESTGNFVLADSPQSTGYLRIGNGPFRWKGLNIPRIGEIDWANAHFPEDEYAYGATGTQGGAGGYGGYGSGHATGATAPAVSPAAPVQQSSRISPQRTADAAAIFEAMRNLDLTPGAGTPGYTPQYGTYSPSGRLPVSPRYAGAAGNILGGIINAGRDADHVDWGQYYPAFVAGNLSLQDVRYVPNDFRQASNEIGAQSNATRSAIENSGAGPSTDAALVANGYNANMGQGNAFWQTQLANLQSRNAAVAQNNEAEKAMQDFAFRRNLYNTNIANEAALQNKQLYMDQTIRNIGYQNDKWNAISQMLDAGLTDLSNIGRENFVMNQINSNSALFYGVGPDGWAYYKAYDGLDKRTNPKTGETQVVVDRSQIPTGSTAGVAEIPADFMPGSLPSVRAARWAREKDSYVPSVQQTYEPVYTKRGEFGVEQEEDPYWWAVRKNGGKLLK